MPSRFPHRHGFTLLETLVAIGIVILIGTIGIQTFYSSKKIKEIGPAADSIAATLERAKADAVAGKDGQSWGVHFASSSYAYFQGETYAATSPTDQFGYLPGDLVISSTFSGNQVVFAHLTGTPSASGTVTVRDAASTTAKTVSVGSSGDISVLQ